MVRRVHRAEHDVAMYHVGNDTEAHGWIVDALRRTPGVVVLHDFVIHHLVAGLTIGRHDGKAYLDAMEREAGVAGRLLGYGVLEKRMPPLWEKRPEDFPLAGEVLGLADGLIVHSRYVETSCASRIRRADLHRAHPAFPVPSVAPVEVAGDPALRQLRQRQRQQARAAAARGVRARLRRRGTARLLLVGAKSPGFDLDRRLERPASTAPASYARGTSRRSGCGR